MVMDLLTIYLLCIFSVVFLMNIAIWDYVVAVNGNGFSDNFFCSVYFLLFC